MSHLDRNPLDGPFPTAVQLTDYSDQPGYAIRPGDGQPGQATPTARRLHLDAARLAAGRTYRHCPSPANWDAYVEACEAIHVAEFGMRYDPEGGPAELREARDLLQRSHWVV